MYKIGITIGDINGIGPEVTLKAIHQLYDEQDLEIVIISPRQVVEDVCDALNLMCNASIKVIEPEVSESMLVYQPGIPSDISGEIAYKSIVKAIELFNARQIDAIATAPISKNALNKAGYLYSGHTEIFQQFYQDSCAQMLFATRDVKLLLLTRHIPLKQVPLAITRELIIENTLHLADNLLKDFGIRNPKLAICGLNPHAGEEGKIGLEEELVIIPAIEELSRQNIDISGPFPADSFWHSVLDYDCVIALYHDQGLIPLKLLYRDTLVNVTAGLTLIRTSPCHGTAFDIAGKNMASEKSMVQAILMAKTIAETRQQTGKSD